MKSRGGVLIGAVASSILTALVVGGLAWAAIPDPGTGLFHACANKITGVVRVIDPAKGQTCIASGVLAETSLRWSQAGPPGRDGEGVAVAAEPSGANCANGGTSFTVGTITSYACNGSDGAPGAPGTPGVTTNCVGYPHTGIDWHGCSLWGANLSGANLNNANLNNALLTSADLSAAKLNNAKLNNADVYGANLRGADLTGAELQSATLTTADLTGANLFAADLTGAELSEITWHNTTCPDGTNSNAQQPQSCVGHFVFF